MVEVLHGEAPGAWGFGYLGDHRGAAGVGAEKIADALGVADGGRKANAARIDLRHAGEALDQADGLKTAVGTQQRVHLVDHDVAQVAEEARDHSVLAHKQGFQGLGRDLQNAAGVLQELCLVRGRDIPVPVPNLDVRAAAQVFQPVELVVDEGLCGANVERPHRHGRILPKLAENREECGLGLARCGCGTQKNVVLRIKDGLACGNLDAS